MQTPCILSGGIRPRSDGGKYRVYPIWRQQLFRILRGGCVAKLRRLPQPAAIPDSGAALLEILLLRQAMCKLLEQSGKADDRLERRYLELHGKSGDGVSAFRSLVDELRDLPADV